MNALSSLQGLLGTAINHAPADKSDALSLTTSSGQGSAGGGGFGALIAAIVSGSEAGEGTATSGAKGEGEHNTALMGLEHVPAECCEGDGTAELAAMLSGNGLPVPTGEELPVAVHLPQLLAAMLGNETDENQTGLIKSPKIAPSPSQTHQIAAGLSKTLQIARPQSVIELGSDGVATPGANAAVKSVSVLQHAINAALAPHMMALSAESVPIISGPANQAIPAPFASALQVAAGLTTLVAEKVAEALGGAPNASGSKAQSAGDGGVPAQSGGKPIIPPIAINLRSTDGQLKTALFATPFGGQPGDGFSAQLNLPEWLRSSAQAALQGEELSGTKATNIGASTAASIYALKAAQVGKPANIAGNAAISVALADAETTPLQIQDGIVSRFPRLRTDTPIPAPLSFGRPAPTLHGLQPAQSDESSSKAGASLSLAGTVIGKAVESGHTPGSTSDATLSTFASKIQTGVEPRPAAYLQTGAPSFAVGAGAIEAAPTATPRLAAAESSLANADSDAAMASLVDRLVSARENTSAAQAVLAVKHKDFGQIDMHFRQTSSGVLSVEVSSTDGELPRILAGAASSDLSGQRGQSESNAAAMARTRGSEFAGANTGRGEGSGEGAANTSHEQAQQQREDRSAGRPSDGSPSETQHSSADLGPALSEQDNRGPRGSGGVYA